ncbi:MAG: hypothetical protein DWQ44_03530 [Bacteroidetes bacterium]|nr:MAG: hypothetical protein DWQ33_04270 [Bacteroidota bacterium]REJ99937.1 MAG: hypothetical protein DWQ39_13545 [Bacteroidota bacterium]REK35883.1 MAG: hypothetical protein DWQ44_03530 [Bacteroidota bacterium]REK50640.1 MAG: hypothetical protein DWQ48_04835 [Bacteroidota bacterium]
MKKVLSFFVAASMFAIVACGPSAEEKQAQEKAAMDSIAAAQAAEAAAAEQAAMQDTMNAMQMTTDTVQAQ